MASGLRYNAPFRRQQWNEQEGNTVDSVVLSISPSPSSVVSIIESVMLPSALRDGPDWYWAGPA